MSRRKARSRSKPPTPKPHEEALHRRILNALGAYRLLHVMTWQQARSYTKKVLGQPLFENRSDWEGAYQYAQLVVAHYRDQMRKAQSFLGPVKHLSPLENPIERSEWDFAPIPALELPLALGYEYSREAVRTGAQ
jgi:hypothetical protein